MNKAQAGKLGGASTSAAKGRAAKRNGKRGGRPFGTRKRWSLDLKRYDPWKYLRAHFNWIHGRSYEPRRKKLTRYLSRIQHGICRVCATSLRDTRLGRPVVHHCFSIEDYAARLHGVKDASIIESTCDECNDLSNLELVHHGCNIKLGLRAAKEGKL